MNRTWRDIALACLLIAASAEILFLWKRVSTLQRRLASLDAAETPIITDGIQLLPLEGRDFSGAKVKIISDRKYLVLYLSPKCRECKAIAPAWKTAAEAVGRRNVVVMVPNTPGLTGDRVIGYLKETDLPYDVGILLGDAQIRKYGLYAVPTTLLLDQKGLVTKVWQGPVSSAVLIDSWHTSSGKRGLSETP